MNATLHEDFLQNNELQGIIKEYRRVQQLKEEASFNLFTISMRTSYQENFHSDVIAALLDPKGLHKQERTFLDLFLAFLRTKQVDLPQEGFQNATVRRETGRIDIWIKDESTQKSIIIENKINNAPDMIKQIDRYDKYADLKSFPAQAIVYLSLDGSKTAPKTDSEITQAKVINMAAFSGKSDDLVNGWLERCLQATDANSDSFAVINQYIKLIKHLAKHKMEDDVLNNLYKYLNTPEKIKTLEDMNRMYAEFPRLRADNFRQTIEKQDVFARIAKYKPEYWIFEFLVVDKMLLKLDVWFNQDGSACVEFWNFTQQNPDGRDILDKVLQKTGLQDIFDIGRNYADNGYRKTFTFSETILNLTTLDHEVSAFVNNLLKKFAEYPKTGS